MARGEPLDDTLPRKVPFAARPRSNRREQVHPAERRLLDQHRCRVAAGHHRLDRFEDLSGEGVHPITVVQSLVLLAIQLAVGNMGREEARSLINETVTDGLEGAAMLGLDETTH